MINFQDLRHRREEAKKKSTGPKFPENPAKLGYPGTYDDFDFDAKVLLDNFPFIVGTEIKYAPSFLANPYGEVRFDLKAGPQIQRTFHHSAINLWGILSRDLELEGFIHGDGRMTAEIKPRDAEDRQKYNKKHVRKPSYYPFELNAAKIELSSGSLALSYSLELTLPGDAWALTGSVDRKTIALSYMQSFWRSPHIAMGLQFASFWPLAKSTTLLIPVVTYYKKPDTVTLQYIPGQKAIFLSYHQKFNPYCSIATNLAIVAQTHESNWSIAGKIDFMEFLDWEYHARITGEGTVSVAYKTKLFPKIMMTLSAELFHFQNQPPMFGIAFECDL